MPVLPHVASSDHTSEYAFEDELHLFIAGPSPRADAGLRNLLAICTHHLPGRYSLVVVELQQHPERAQQDSILGVPGLVRRLVGDLSQTDRVLNALGLGAKQVQNPDGEPQ